MKLFCPLSGVSYRTNVGQGHGQAPHPIFYLPTRQIIAQNLDAFVSGKLTKAETHLVGCAILHKLPVVWEVTLPATPDTAYIFKKNLERLAAITLKFEERHYTDKDIAELPHFHLDDLSHSITNLNEYLESLNDSMISMYAMSSSESSSPKPAYLINRSEEIIIGMLRRTLNKSEKRNELPKLIAQWAEDVGNFPSSTFVAGNGNTVTISAHWKAIIEDLFKATDYTHLITGDVTYGDITELLEHCECEILPGSLHSMALFKRLREAQSVLEEFKNPRPKKEDITVVGDITAALLGETGESVSSGESLGSQKSQERETQEGEPLRKNFSSTAKYLQAKLRWQRSQR